MEELTIQEMECIEAGGKFCDFVGGFSVGLGFMALLGGPVTWGLNSVVLIADAGCLFGIWS